MDKIKFGLFLKEARMEKDLTQAELAEQLYIDTTTVSKWERGINYPDISLIPDICKILGVTEHELMENARDTEYRAIKYQAARYIKIKRIAFWCYTGAFLIALFTTFIVNLAVNHTLSWFFIVLASCVCGYFATMFPILFPMITAKQSKPSCTILSRLSLLIYSTGLLIFTLAILFCTNLYSPFNIVLAIKITLYCFLILFLYGLVKWFNIRRMTKIGIGCIITGLYSVSLAKVLPYLMQVKEENYFDIDFSDWKNHTNGNVALIILLSFGVVGIGLILWSCIKKHSEK